jgi:hypothetical protein
MGKPAGVELPHGGLTICQAAAAQVHKKSLLGQELGDFQANALVGTGYYC